MNANTPATSPATSEIPYDEQDPLLQQVAAYALGALEAGEEDAVEEFLDASPDGRALLREYDEILRLMPYGLPPATPSPGTRSLLIARAQMRREAAAAAAPPTWWRQRRTQVIALSVAAVLTVLLASAVIINQFQDTDPANQTAEEMITAMRDDPDAKVVRMEGTAAIPDAGANLIMSDEHDDAGLIAWNLPVQSYDRCYQLWFEHADGTRVSGGTFWVDDSGAATSLVSMPDNFDEVMEVEVTDEPMGGSSKPTGPNIISASMK